MPGPWKIDGQPKRKFNCFGKVCVAARREAQRRKGPVRVRCLSPKRAGNRHIDRSDFAMHPNGRRDATVDPTWYQKRRK